MNKQHYNFQIEHRNNLIFLDDFQDFNEIELQVSFDNILSSSVQMEKIVLHNEAYKFVKDITKDSLFEDVRLIINLFFNDVVVKTFFLKLDFSNATFFDEREIPQVEIAVKNITTDFLFDSINSNSFTPENLALLLKYDQRIMEKTFVLIEKEDASLEVATLSVAVFSMSYSLYQMSYSFAVDVINIINTVLAGEFTGSIIAVVYPISVAAVRAILIAFMIDAIIKIVDLLTELIVPRVYEKSILNVGYTIKSIFGIFGFQNFGVYNVPEFFDIYYLPSNNQKQDLKQNEYYPSVTDFGYLFTEFIQIALEMFNLKIYFNEKTKEIILANENDDYFYNREGEYELLDMLSKQYMFNVQDFNSKEIFSYSTDFSDTYTITNKQGYSYEVDNVIDNNNTYFNLLDKKINVALVDRKNSTSALEEAILEFWQLYYKTFKFLGASAKAKNLANRIGLPKIDNKIWSIPKVFYAKKSNVLDSSSLKNIYKLPENHRSLIGMNTLYKKYFYKTSFLGDMKKMNFRKIYNEVEVPFDYRDYEKVIDNPVISIKRNNITEKGRVTNLTWNLAKDTAKISFYLTHAYNLTGQQRFTES